MKTCSDRGVMSKLDTRYAVDSSNTERHWKQECLKRVAIKMDTNWIYIIRAWTLNYLNIINIIQFNCFQLLIFNTVYKLYSMVQSILGICSSSESMCFWHLLIIGSSSSYRILRRIGIQLHTFRQGAEAFKKAVWSRAYTCKQTQQSLEIQLNAIEANDTSRLLMWHVQWPNPIQPFWLEPRPKGRKARVSLSWAKTCTVAIVASWCNRTGTANWRPSRTMKKGTL